MNLPVATRRPASRMGGFLLLLTSVFAFNSPTELPAQNWPSFRGPNGSGVSQEAKSPPISWSVSAKENVKWKAPIAGRANSSPIVWGDSLFLTTAISAESSADFELAESGRSVATDESELEWKIVALNKRSGELIWERTACKKRPRAGRHLKSSQCNSTPATDGRYVVAVMGSEGLFCFSFDGELLWNKDLGVLDGGYVGRPEFQWGHGSSPILNGDTVIVQVDKFENSYLAAFSLSDGTEVWSAQRNELPTWCTPTVWQHADRVEVVANGGNFARGYDAKTGQELWRYEDRAEVKVSTPVIADGIAYLSGGAPRGRQIIAIQSGYSADPSRQAAEVAEGHAVWVTANGSSYTTTPIVYDGLLYVCSDSGILTCYDAKSSERKYRARLGGNFSASPVAADGKLYCADEDGTVHVIEAGPSFSLLATNEMGGGCMATPAISGGTIYVRTLQSVFAISK